MLSVMVAQPPVVIEGGSRAGDLWPWLLHRGLAHDVFMGTTTFSRMEILDEAT